MNCADILDLYRYTEWANERIAAALLPLPEETFNRDWGGSHPTLRDAFAHVVASEWIWLERWNGLSPADPPAWMDERGAAAIVEQMRIVNERRAEFLGALDESSLNARLAFKFLSGKAGEHRLGDLLVHVANHSTYHRGQLASMLRQAGATPPGTDFVYYRDECGPLPEA
ncbi:MAG: DinB family protein [Acidobacteria bacterium]|nr:DinB family protein [Acidobacteriota bacterium]